MKRTPQKLLGLMAAAAVLAGCDGSDGTSTAPDQAQAQVQAPAVQTAPSGGLDLSKSTYIEPVDPHSQSHVAPKTAALQKEPSPGCYSTALTRRLTRSQLVNTLSEFANAMVPDAGVAARIQTLVVETAQFPLDSPLNPDSTRHQGYYRIDQTLNSRQTSSIYAIAQALAADLTSTDAKLSTLLGSCTPGDACITAFIKKAGRILYRQPLSDAEVNVFRAVAGNASDKAAVNKVLASMIASPKTYFVVENGDATGTGSCINLTAHELATRLSLHLWDSIPDAELNKLADSGELLKPAVYQEQVKRMMADARAETAMRSFFRQWFRLDELVALDGKVGNAVFDAFANGYKPLSTTRDAAINEVLDMVSFVASKNGSVQQVLTNRNSFARTQDLATLYKTPVWNGGATPPTFAEAERVGLLTRIGIIASGSSDTTLPIQRGIKVLSALTCQELPAPVMDQSNKNADLSGVLTTRERVSRVTQMEGTSCVNCHTGIINPWGFVFEGFDALGRVRTTEVTRDDKGNSLGQKPVDTGVVAGLDGLATRSISTAAQAQQYVLESGHFERCFAKNYFRYAFGRADVPSDNDVIESVRTQAVNGANLRSLFASIVTRPEFKTIKKPV